MVPQGHVVEVHKFGDTICYICDDYCKDVTEEQVQEILDRIARKIQIPLYLAEKERERKEQEDAEKSRALSGEKVNTKE